jgi:hypothetical protein
MGRAWCYTYTVIIVWRADQTCDIGIIREVMKCYKGRDLTDECQCRGCDRCEVSNIESVSGYLLRHEIVNSSLLWIPLSSGGP